MLKEMPQVGDKVRYVGDELSWMTVGKTYEIAGVDRGGDPFFIDEYGDEEYVFADEFSDYELVTQAEAPDTAALIANLALRVGELERQNAQQALEINELYRAYVGREARL